MNCMEWQQEFKRVSEEWREIPPAMAEHAENCVRCGRQLEAFRLLSGKKSWVVEVSPWLV